MEEKDSEIKLGAIDYQEVPNFLGLWKFFKGLKNFNSFASFFCQYTKLCPPIVFLQKIGVQVFWPPIWNRVKVQAALNYKFLTNFVLSLRGWKQDGSKEQREPIFVQFSPNI